MLTKLWNRDLTNGFASDIPLGGLPVFTEDLQDAQNISTELYGSLALLKGWSCVLRGCYIDDLNISTQRCSITEGIILLNDICYYVPALTNVSYPFAFIKGATTIDSRLFKDAGVKDVAISYDYGIQTSFTYPTGLNLNSTIPSNLSNEAIYFDPFTAQRFEYLIQNNSKGQGEIISINNNLNVISKSETGKAIIGGTLGALVNGSGRWKYLGYTNFVNNEFCLRNSVTTTVGTLNGVNDITLSKGNIPIHVHDKGTLANSSNGSHVHGVTIGKSIGSDGTSGSFQSSAIDGTFPANISIDAAGNHTHTISGQVGDATADGLKASPDSFSVKSNSLYVNMLQWNGYQSIQSFYQFYKNVLPYSNM